MERILGRFMSAAGRLFQNARTLLVSDEPGRRWAALEMLRGAEGLRIRQGVERIDELLKPKSKQGSEENLVAASALGHWSDLAGGKPSRSDLRTQAVAAILLNDSHVFREWSGMAHSVSPEGRFAASVVIDLEQETGAVVITDLANGKEVSKWEGADAEKIAGTAIALGPQAKRLASISMDVRQVNVWELPDRKLLRRLSLPKPAAKDPSSAPTNGNGLRALIPFEILRSISFSPR